MLYSVWPDGCISYSIFGQCQQWNLSKSKSLNFAKLYTLNILKTLPKAFSFLLITFILRIYFLILSPSGRSYLRAMRFNILQILNIAKDFWNFAKGAKFRPFWSHWLYFWKELIIFGPPFFICTSFNLILSTASM